MSIYFLIRTKYLSDDWMITRGFMEIPEDANQPWWTKKQISEIGQLLKPLDTYIVTEDTTISEALQRLKSNSIDCLLHFENG